MYARQSYTNVCRNQVQTFFLVIISVIFLLLSVVPAQAAEKDEVICGRVNLAPGLFWPLGTWEIDSKRVVVTKETVFKGDRSKAIFGAMVEVKGLVINGVFTISEFEIKTDELLCDTR
ncbi:MAG: hypothetical protein D3909_07110 [Candidatus Electrothrix sp. ATG1]|nr:hypothetical protein [Candidatus Electrothrix sp. ATG1]